MLCTSIPLFCIKSGNISMLNSLKNIPVCGSKVIEKKGLEQTTWETQCQETCEQEWLFKSMSGDQQAANTVS